MQLCMARMPHWSVPIGRRLRDAARMNRHDFLNLLLGAGAAGSGLLGCAPASQSISPTAGARPKIAALCFDLFTLFDPRSVVEVARNITPERAAALCETWRVRQFEYAWLRVAAGQYRDFRHVTGEALDYAAEVHAVTLSTAQRESLIAAYSTLRPWPDTVAHLQRWKQRGLRMAPLANYSPRMLEELLAHAGVSDFFETQLSTDRAHTFKPAAAAYALGTQTFGLPKEQIAFCAFGGWDAAGAKWFGYPTFWVNRLRVTGERLAPGPDGTGPTLAEFARFVDTW